MHSAVLLSLLFRVRGVPCRCIVSSLFQMYQPVDVPTVLLKSLPHAVASLSPSPSVVQVVNFVCVPLNTLQSYELFFNIVCFLILISTINTKRYISVLN